MSKTLNENQLRAIKYLAQPNGMSQEEIAEKVGVSRQTLYRWRSDLDFQDEIKREINRNTLAHIPAVMNTLQKKAVEGDNKSAELLLKSLSMLNNVVEVEDRKSPRSERTHDVDAMKAEIERMRLTRVK
jgi:transcriptional regulator with XRE-family HTH domain